MALKSTADSSEEVRVEAALVDAKLNDNSYTWKRYMEQIKSEKLYSNISVGIRSVLVLSGHDGSQMIKNSEKFEYFE